MIYFYKYLSHVRLPASQPENKKRSFFQSFHNINWNCIDLGIVSFFACENMGLYKLDDLIERCIRGKDVRHAPLPSSESSWQTFYEVWKALSQYIGQQLEKGVVRLVRMCCSRSYRRIGCVYQGLWCIFVHCGGFEGR